ncbi:hypothetical protein Ddye_002198 [Dipteronia dyeriana]|uniref:Cytochrome P450 n=1 Tax=Dipteronia dyeriana TaxID=168575 RepID=A0AAE0CU94_9ROSI|nr:hypothetical protein Ddye_002198 [Dipteronia dyeriana]
MFLHLGQSPTLIVSSTEMAREMMKTHHDVVFSNRPNSTAANILLYGCQDLGFAPYDDYWRHAKKISVQQLLSNKRVQSFHYVRDEEVTFLINKIHRSCYNDGGSSVDLMEMIQAVINNIVSRCVLGRRTEEENGNKKFGELARRLMVQFTTFCFGDMFPCLGWNDG